ncbi:MAG: hypothetical protein LBR80_17885 [Deltaproteobacteria bacterium]|jgi:NitT/TauT family transport system substrate-binding protein|nr:hypothetical protein [Deltaproteobacteria bacterium]
MYRPAYAHDRQPKAPKLTGSASGEPCPPSSASASLPAFSFPSTPSSSSSPPSYASAPPTSDAPANGRRLAVAARAFPSPLAFLAATLLAALALAGPSASSAAAAPEGSGPRGAVLVYSATGATSAALPLLGALEKGWPGGPVTVEEWKSLDDLKGLVLSGKGDVWVGHLEAFGRAAAMGAAVRLLAVTAWQKFYFVSGPFKISPQPQAESRRGEMARGGEAWPASPEQLAKYLADERLPLYTAPQSGPASGALARLASLGGAAFDVRSLPMQQVLLELASGRARAALVPEPGASAALSRNPSLRIVGNLEEELAWLAGGLPRLPHAGVALRAGFADANPELADGLKKLMAESAAEFAAMPPEEAVSHLPKTLIDGMGADVLAASLSRDPIMSVGAADAAPEIMAFLCIAAPELCPDGKLEPSFPRGFIY